MVNLFNNINTDNLSALKACLRAVNKKYFKDEIIYNYDDNITSVGYILKGKVKVFKDDYENRRVLVANHSEGETFAEAFVCLGIKQSPIIVLAEEDTEMLFIDFNRILGVCNNSCQFHTQLIDNIIKIIAEKNIYLNFRIEMLSKSSLRERIKIYLVNQKGSFSENIFEIPFSREDMADFLGVNRSALSRELSKMKEENLIDYHKNSFKIKF